jgi:hypothetical protein
VRCAIIPPSSPGRHKNLRHKARIWNNDETIAGLVRGPVWPHLGRRRNIGGMGTGDLLERDEAFGAFNSKQE